MGVRLSIQKETKFFQGWVQVFPECVCVCVCGGGGGVLLLFPMETYTTYDFQGEGGLDPLPPPSLDPPVQ